MARNWPLFQDFSFMSSKYLSFTSSLSKISVCWKTARETFHVFLFTIKNTKGLNKSQGCSHWEEPHSHPLWIQSWVAYTELQHFLEYYQHKQAQHRWYWMFTQRYKTWIQLKKITGMSCVISIKIVGFSSEHKDKFVQTLKILWSIKPQADSKGFKQTAEMCSCCML